MIKILNLVILLIVLLAPTVRASGLQGWHDSYRGEIGSDTGGLTLVYEGNAVEAEIYFDRDYSLIPLKGVKDARSISLRGTDITIHGEFAEFDERFGDEKLTSDVLKGTISRNGKTEQFHLYLSHGSAGDLENKYIAQGKSENQIIESFAMRFKQAVLLGDKNSVGEMLMYPVNVNLKSGDKVELKTLEEFLKYYDEIFYPQFVAAMEQAVPVDMFSKHSGVMMSSDENAFWVWMTSGPKATKVISIFSDTTKLAGGEL